MHRNTLGHGPSLKGVSLVTLTPVVTPGHICLNNPKALTQLSQGRSGDLCSLVFPDWPGWGKQARTGLCQDTGISNRNKNQINRSLFPASSSLKCLKLCLECLMLSFPVWNRLRSACCVGVGTTCSSPWPSHELKLSPGLDKRVFGHCWVLGTAQMFQLQDASKRLFMVSGQCERREVRSCKEICLNMFKSVAWIRHQKRWMRLWCDWPHGGME